MNTNTNTTIDREAAEPTRATTSITLTAGAMVFPLSIYTATEDLTVRRSERYNGDPAISIGRALIRKDTEEVVQPHDVTRMAEAVDGDGTGKWVVFDDNELASVYGETGEAVIVSFVPTDETGRYVFDGIMQVRSKNDKRKATQAANEQAFSLLLAGMAGRQVHALIRFVLRGGPRYGLLTADGDLLTIIPANAVRSARALPMHEHDDASVDMMGKFIDTIGIASQPVVDDTPEKLQAAINDKAAEHGVEIGDAPAVAPKTPTSLDVMVALEESIERAKSVRKAPAKKKAAARKKVSK